MWSGRTQHRSGQDTSERDGYSYSSSGVQSDAHEQGGSQSFGDEEISDISDGDAINAVSSDEGEPKPSRPDLTRYLSELSPAIHGIQDPSSQQKKPEEMELITSSTTAPSLSPLHTSENEAMAPDDGKAPNGKRKGDSDSENKPLSKRAKSFESAPDQQVAQTMTGTHPGSVDGNVPTRSSSAGHAETGSSKPTAEAVAGPAFPTMYHDERVCEMLLRPHTFNDYVYDLRPNRRAKPQPAFMSGALPQTDHTAVAVTDDDGYGVDAAVDEPRHLYPDDPEYSSGTDTGDESRTELHAENTTVDLTAPSSEVGTATDDAIHDILSPLAHKRADRTMNSQDAVEDEKEFEDITTKRHQEGLGEKAARALQHLYDAGMASHMQGQPLQTPDSEKITSKRKQTTLSDDSFDLKALNEQVAKDLDKFINPEDGILESSDLEWADVIFAGARSAGHFKHLMEPEELEAVAIAFKKALNPDYASLEDSNLAVKAVRKLRKHWMQGRLEKVSNIAVIMSGLLTLQQYLHQSNPARDEDHLNTDQSRDGSLVPSGPDVLLVRQPHKSIADGPDPQPGSPVVDAGMEAALIVTARMDFLDAISTGDPLVAIKLRAILACLDYAIHPETYKEPVDARRMKSGYAILLDGIAKRWLEGVTRPECLDVVVRVLKKALNLPPVEVQLGPEAGQTKQDNDVTMDDEPSGPPGSVADDMSSPPTDSPADGLEWDLSLKALAVEELQEALTSGKLKARPGILSQTVDCLEKAGIPELGGQLDADAASMALCYLCNLVGSGKFQGILTREYLDAAIRVLERETQHEQTEAHSRPDDSREQLATGCDTADGPASPGHADVRECADPRTDCTEPNALDRQLVSDALRKFKELEFLGRENPLNRFLDGGSIDTAIAALIQALGNAPRHQCDKKCLKDALDEFETNEDGLWEVLGPLTSAITVEALKRAKPAIDGSLSEHDSELSDDDHRKMDGHRPDYALAAETLQKLRGELHRVAGGGIPAMDPHVVRAAIAAISHLYAPDYQLQVDTLALGKALSLWRVQRCLRAREGTRDQRHVDLVIEALTESLRSRAAKAAFLLDCSEDPAVLDTCIEPELRMAAVEALDHARYDQQFDITAERGDLVKALYAFEHAEETGLLEGLREHWVIPVTIMALKRAINILAWLSLPRGQRRRTRLPSRCYPAMQFETGTWVPPPPLPYRLSSRHATAGHVERGMALVRSRELLFETGLQRYTPQQWYPHPDDIFWPIPCRPSKGEAERMRKKISKWQFKLGSILGSSKKKDGKRTITQHIARGMGLAKGERVPSVCHPPLPYRPAVPPEVEDDTGRSHRDRNGATDKAGDPSSATEQIPADTGNGLAHAMGQLAVYGLAEQGQNRPTSSIDAVWPEGDTGETLCDSEALPPVEKQIAESLLDTTQRQQAEGRSKRKSPTKFILRKGRFVAATPGPSTPRKDHPKTCLPPSSRKMCHPPSRGNHAPESRSPSQDSSMDSPHEPSGDFFIRPRRNSAPESSPHSPQRQPVCCERALTPAPPSPSASIQLPPLKPETRRIGDHDWTPPGPSPLHIVTSADDLPDPPHPPPLPAGQICKTGLMGGGPERFPKSLNRNTPDGRDSGSSTGRWVAEGYDDRAGYWGDYASPPLGNDAMEIAEMRE